METCWSSWCVETIVANPAKYLSTDVCTAIPHAVTEDNIYDGFFIPKGKFICCIAIRSRL